jgi:fructose-1-phosphate kinase PfkB-like protein
MTAALAVAVAQGRPSEEALRLACAAGAANVARRGLASAGSDLIAQLVERVEVERLREVTT